MRAREALAADGFELFYGLQEYTGWSDYVAHYHETRFGRDLRDGEVPTMLLAAEVGGTFVGHVGVRLATNPAEVPRGGHVGYAVLAPFRRQGLASEMLRQAMILLRAEGVGEVVVTCRDTNFASAAVIEGRGGRLESVFDFGDAKGDMRRYVIALPAHTLYLRPLTTDDEAVAVAAHRAMVSDDTHFLLNWSSDDEWNRYVSRMCDLRLGRDVPAGLVRSAFLSASVGDELVGRGSIRFALNEALTSWHGHIGYAVLDAHRRRGYATEILGQALVIARAEGVTRVLMTCEDENIASSSVIERHGGRLNSIGVTNRFPGKWRRYYVD